MAGFQLPILVSLTLSISHLLDCHSTAMLLHGPRPMLHYSIDIRILSKAVDLSH